MTNTRYAVIPLVSDFSAIPVVPAVIVVVVLILSAACMVVGNYFYSDNRKIANVLPCTCEEDKAICAESKKFLTIGKIMMGVGAGVFLIAAIAAGYVLSKHAEKVSEAQRHAISQLSSPGGLRLQNQAGRQAFEDASFIEKVKSRFQ